jgi:transposase
LVRHQAALDEGRYDGIIAQPGHESRRFPVTGRYVTDQPPAPLAAAAQPRHLSIRPGFVDKNELVRIKRVDKPMNGALFAAWLEQSLVPTLTNGDTVIMDNLPAHKVGGVDAIIESVGARLLYLPSYSPDFNPIEMMFAKLKALLRKAAERTIDNLWDRIEKILDEFSPQECSNYLRHRGYGST